jgi:hypothetical protein
MLSLRGSDPDVRLRFKLYVNDLGRPEDTRRTTGFKVFEVRLQEITVSAMIWHS